MKIIYHLILGILITFAFNVLLIYIISYIFKPMGMSGIFNSVFMVTANILWFVINYYIKVFKK